MNTLMTRDGKEIKTFRELKSIIYFPVDFTKTQEAKVKFNGEDCTVYRHWSNADLGYFIYKGENTSDCVAGINTKGEWYPVIDSKGNQVNSTYFDGSNTGNLLMDCILEIEIHEN